jgi:hypothetical protein
MVQPASATQIEDYPILVIQEHTESTPKTVNGRLNPALTPVPMLYPASNPSPVLRLKTNIVRDELILVWSCDHRALDGTIFLAIFDEFATFSRDPNSPRKLATAPDVQDKTRQEIHEIASAIKPQRLPWTLISPSASRAKESREFIDSCRFALSSSYVLDHQKIVLLRDAYILAGSSLPEKHSKSPPSQITPLNMIVSALVSLCTNRARLKAFPNEREQPSDLLIATNIRKAGHIPRSYMGNCILPAESKGGSSVLPPPEVLHNIPLRGSLGALQPEDIWHVYNIAKNLRQARELLDRERIQGVIANLSRSHDWGSFQPGYGVSMFISDIKAASPYMNLGPLGDVQSFDMYVETLPGLCFILPDPPGSEPSWRLRLVLERAAMECLSSDPLFRWALAPTVCRDAKM